MADDRQDDSDIKFMWKSALEEYNRQTKRPLSAQTLSAVSKIATPEDVARLIEESGADFAGFRSEKKQLWSTLKKFAAPVSMVANIAVTPASTADFGAASSAVLGAVVYLVNACEGVSNAYDWIEQVFRELQDFTERLGLYVGTHIDANLRRKMIAILGTLLKVLGRSEHLIRERRFREYLRVTFLGKDATTKNLVDELNKLLGSEQRYVLGVTYATTQRTEEATKAINERLKETTDTVKEVWEQQKKSETKASIERDGARLKDTLCATSAWDDVEETYIRNERALLQGTGSWLENESLFQSWMRREASILWIFGGPGAGKTFLSTSIIKQLIKRRSTPTVQSAKHAEALAYFFVKENSEVLRDANTILKTLAWQIAAGSGLQGPCYRRLHPAQSNDNRGPYLGEPSPGILSQSGGYSTFPRSDCPCGRFGRGHTGYKENDPGPYQRCCDVSGTRQFAQHEICGYWTRIPQKRYGL
ncbi:hypothetical protein QBC35DRAFT_507126 [Podospora australis]|uniref:Fungal STAND N-terminal Goodbye domain-containing protein n=1 Tax=Podospora australis TaxID=1536484 RepID=A0AAN7AEP4_9PEZI|nr:hypothetical protein QBC35DRAFT_507126 [Podospora australis]